MRKIETTIIALSIALNSSLAWAHQKCGHPGKPICADGWTSSEAEPTQSSTSEPSTDQSSINDVPQGSCDALARDMHILCAGQFDIPECDGWTSALTVGVMPVSSCEATKPDQPIVKSNTSPDSTTGDSRPALTDGSSNTGPWMHGDRWEQTTDPNSPGRIDFANTRTFDVNPVKGGAYNPLNVSGNGVTLTARRISDRATIGGAIDAAAANQGQDASNVTWTGGIVSQPSGDIGDHGYAEAKVRITDVNGAGGGFWLYTSDPKKCENCEIDVFDKVGDAGKVYAHVHNGQQIDETTWSANPGEWNTYAIQRRGSVADLYLNGTKVQTVQTPGFEGVPMHTMLSVAGDNYNRVPTDVNSVSLGIKDLKTRQ